MFVAKKFVNHLHFSSFLDIFLSFSVIFISAVDDFVLPLVFRFLSRGF